MKQLKLKIQEKIIQHELYSAGITDISFVLDKEQLSTTDKEDNSWSIYDYQYDA